MMQVLFDKSTVHFKFTNIGIKKIKDKNYSFVLQIDLAEARYEIKINVNCFALINSVKLLGVIKIYL